MTVVDYDQSQSQWLCALPEYSASIKAGLQEKDATRGLKTKIKKFKQKLKQDNKLVLKVQSQDTNFLDLS